MSVDFREYFYYDETSPSCLRWKVDRKMSNTLLVSAGDVAGCLEANGYYSVGLLGDRHKAHKIVLALHNKFVGEGDVIDHIEGVDKGNFISNLRIIPYRANCMNVQLSPTVSGKIGVTLIKNNPPRMYFRASWVTSDGKVRTKSFNIEKYGYDEALRLACIYRDDRIKELNSIFAQYTDRHIEGLK